MNSGELRTRHLEIDLSVDFEAHRFAGHVVHELKRPAAAGEQLELDTSGLVLESVEASAGTSFALRRHQLGTQNAIFGTALLVALEPGDQRVRIHYQTGPAASGLQWLRPEQTRGGLAPFLYTQGQTIHTRSWLPCYDRPDRRATFTATIRTDPRFTALMAAPERQQLAPGLFQFQMPYAIPSYLIALAVGRIGTRSLGPRCAVFCEPELLDAAAFEFAATESMLQTCERLFGPYRWGRYDLLVLPPSAPLGGMENPTLTFVTPTILAGDRSLVAIVAHELAHSWSGNLVSNSGWGDFWLNEGFTVYVERRILERLYGRERACLEAAIGRDRLAAALAHLADQPERTRLAQPEPELHPDHSITDVPYEKGFLFLRRLEQVLGRAELDTLLRRWFDENAFQSRSSSDFRRFLGQHLSRHRRAGELDIKEWLEGVGLPTDCPIVRSARADELRLAARQCVDDRLELSALQAWSALDWILFLRYVRESTQRPKAALLRSLAESFRLDDSRNPELLALWLAVCLASGRDEVTASARQFVLDIGRHKLIAPIYDALLKRSDGGALAREIYAEARPHYHEMVHIWLDAKLAFSEGA